MNIYKLIYQSKQEAIDHLLDLEVLIVDEDQNIQYSSNTKAVVHLGQLVDQPGEYDEEGNIITPPVYLQGYHVDVMTVDPVNFGDHEIQVNNPKHTFYL